jgi:hypothetical protein
VSTGASDDLQRVADIARAMVTRYGMDKKLGHTAYETEHGNFLGQPIEGGGRRFSEDTAREIDLAVRDLIEAAYARARYPAPAPRRHRAFGQDSAGNGDAPGRRAAAAERAGSRGGVRARDLSPENRRWGTPYSDGGSGRRSSRWL